MTVDIDLSITSWDGYSAPTLLEEISISYAVELICVYDKLPEKRKNEINKIVADHIDMLFSTLIEKRFIEENKK